MARNLPVFVTGATGAQGGATVAALLAAGMPVRALTRAPGSQAAQDLAAQGADVVAGDFDDAETLRRATAGCGEVFSVQLPPRPSDPDSEMRTGRKLIEAAKAAGVRTFVHTSVARAGDEEGLIGWPEGRWSRDYWTQKSGVNALVRAAEFPRWTILKPAFMMDNLIPPKALFMFPALAGGVIETALLPETRLDLIAASDIGLFAAAAFADPARFDGQEIDLATASPTMGEVAEVIAKVTGKPVIARSLSAEDTVQAGVSPGIAQSHAWSNVEGYRVDLDKAAGHGIPLLSLADWAWQHRADFNLG